MARWCLAVMSMASGWEPEGEEPSGIHGWTSVLGLSWESRPPLAPATPSIPEDTQRRDAAPEFRYHGQSLPRPDHTAGSACARVACHPRPTTMKKRSAMEPSSTIRRLDEPELEKRCMAGDAAAAVELFDRYRTDLVHYCYRYLGNVDDAEDTVQDVAAALSTQVRRPPAPAPGCFGSPATTASTRSAGARTGGSERERSSRSRERRHRAPTPEPAVDRQQQSEELRRQLALLPPEQAEVLSLGYLDGLHRKEVAEVLDLPESVVKSRLFHGARELRKRFAHRDGEDA